MSLATRTVADIAADLESLGLAPGDLVMVHASLRAVGSVEGGADGLIDAIGSVIGDEGTMLMVLGARDDHAWVNERPAAERAALLIDAEPFDAMATPSSPDVGTLAHALLDDVPWNDYFGPGSPLERLGDGGDKVLRLGADLDTVTALHHAEYRCSLEPARRVRRHRLVATPDGPEIRTVDCLDDEKGIVDYPGEDYFADLTRDYLALGRARVGSVGSAPSELLDAADIVAFGVGWMDEHLVTTVEPVSPTNLQRRLDADLLDARKRRSAPEVGAIRALKTALANAESAPVSDGPYEVVDGSRDVPRRELGLSDIEVVIATEAEERRRAIEEYRAIGADTVDLELELAALERYRPAS